LISREDVNLDSLRSLSYLGAVRSGSKNGQAFYFVASTYRTYGNMLIEICETRCGPIARLAHQEVNSIILEVCFF